MAHALKPVVQGWTSSMWLVDFTDSLPKANDMQLEHAIKLIRNEMRRRE